MNVAKLDEMGWAMAEVYEAVTNRILINLARRFPYVQKSDELRGSFDYQARMLAQMGQVTRETVDIIAGSLDGADQALRQTLEEAIKEALKDEEPKLRKAAEQGLLTGTAAEIAPEQMQAFQLYYRQSADKLNLVNTVMLESTEAAYRATVADAASRLSSVQSALNVGAGEVVTGVSAWNKAMHDAVQNMVSVGITGFVDHGGHKWTPEAYVAMDIRTTTFNVARGATWELNEQYGNDLYQVSSHNGARPLCYPWQRKVISRTDNVREVEDLDGDKIQVIAQSATSYGQAAGLFGVNCRHYPMTFIPGFSTLKGKPQDEEDNERVYQESQEQRKLERDLRQERAKMEVLKAQGATKEDIAKQKERVDAASDKIQAFCDKTGRARRYNREYTPVNATWPDKSTWGDVSARKNVVPQATPPLPEPVKMVYGGMLEGADKRGQEKRNAECKAILDRAPDSIKRVWSKCAPDMREPVFGTYGAGYRWRKGQYYSPWAGRVHFDTLKSGWDEDNLHRRNQTFFHESGHFIDNILSGTGRNGRYFSAQYKGGEFGRTIYRECGERLREFYDSLPADDPRKAEGVESKSVGSAFCKHMREKYSLQVRGDISDMFEQYMSEHYGIDYPFGAGHGKKYWKDSQDRKEAEAFAEMFAAMARGDHEQIGMFEEYFPESFKMFQEILEEAVK